MSKERIYDACRRYGIAVLAAAIAIGIRAAMHDALGDTFVFLLFLPAVAAAAWFGGIGPAVLTTVLCALFGVAFFFEPRWSLAISSGADAWRVARFVAEGAAITLLVELVRRYRLRYRSERIEANRSNAALRSQEELLRITLASVGDGLIVTDAEGRVTFMNVVAESLTGWTLAEAEGVPLETVFRIVNEETRNTVDNPAMHALREGRIVGLANHTVLIARNGVERPIDDSAAPIRDADGELRGAVLVFRDVTERKQAERDLRNREERYRLVGEASNDAIWDWDLATDHVTWNPGVQTLFGYAAKDVRPDGGWWIEHIHPDDRDRVAHDIHAVIDGETNDDVWSSEYRFLRVDGSYAEVFDRGRVVREESGKAIRMVGAMLDLTERNLVQRRLREAEERADLVRRSTGVGFWYCDLPFSELIWDERVKSHFFIPADSSVTIDDFYARIHPDDREPTRAAIQKSIDERTAYDIDYRTVDPETGAQRWIHAIGRTTYDGANSPIRFDGVTLDVTARKLGEIAQRESEKRFRDMADNISQLAWMADAKGALWWYNRRWLEYTGTTLEEMFGWGWRNVHHPDHLDRVVTRWSEALQRGEPWEDTFPLRSRDGEYRWFLSRAVPIRNDDGELVRWFGTNTDVTDRLAVEAALKDADRRKDEFLAMLGHELRNPLAPVRSGLQLLQSGEESPEDRRTIVGLMQEQTEHLVRLVDDLLDVSRIVRGRIELRRETVDLRSVVRQATSVVEEQARDRDQRLTTTLPDEPLWVDGDKVRLAQVVENLLTNASKYNADGGSIDVVVRRDGDEIELRVSDSGVGIEPELLPTIFDLFTQSKRSLDRSQGGLGLGLSLVRNIVELHGGSVAVHSDGVDRGSEFVIRLPAAAAPLDRIAQASTDGAARSPSGSPKRILVVDDNRSAALLVAKLLAKLGPHEIECAADGLSALEKFASLRPDLALLDIGLPGLDGYEVAKRIRSDAANADVRLVALTGYGQESDRLDAERAGFDDHLVKPVSLDDLRATLADLER